MNDYYYLTPEQHVVRVRHRARPATYNVPMRSKTFVIQEFMGDKWSMPACPEVTLGTLNKLVYIGWAPVVNS